MKIQLNEMTVFQRRIMIVYKKEMSTACAYYFNTKSVDMHLGIDVYFVS